MTVRQPALTFAMIVLGAFVGLVGYGVANYVSTPNVPDANVNQYAGPDGIRLTIEVTQSNCCYIEGSLRFAVLEGRWQDEWQLTGEQSTIAVPPGEYELTLYERGCNGWCHPTMLGDPANHCSARFVVVGGSAVTARVDFPIPKPCTMEVDSQ